MAFSSDLRRPHGLPTTAERIWNSAPQHAAPQLVGALCLPCPSRSRPVAYGVISLDRPQEVPSRRPPNPRQERNSRGSGSNKDVFWLEIAVDQSPRKTFTPLFDDVASFVPKFEQIKYFTARLSKSLQFRSGKLRRKFLSCRPPESPDTMPVRVPVGSRIGRLRLRRAGEPAVRKGSRKTLPLTSNLRHPPSSRNSQPYSPAPSSTKP